MLEARIQQQLFECADLLNQAAEPLSRSVAEAAHALVGCLTSGSKILVCGTPAAHDLARHMARLLVCGYQRTRPPLAAAALETPPHLGAQQVQALGQPGDILLSLDLGQDAPELLPVWRAALDKDMTLVAATSAADTPLRSLLRETDVRLALPAEGMGRLLEMHLLALHALCDAVDVQLLGEQELA